MIIIVDSIDRVGKTTLCRKLASETGFKIYKHSEKNKDYSKMTDDGETSAMMAMIDLYRLYPENGVIFDRFHLSNYAYGTIGRGYDKDKAICNFIKVDWMLSEFDDVILVKVNPTDIKRSSSEHGSDLSEHMEIFNKLFATSAIKNKFECNYLTIDATVEKIKSIISK